MSGLLTWARRLFIKEKRKVAVDDLFAPIDPAQVEELLGVDFLAKQSGEQELPASDSQTFDSNELKIEHFFEEDAQDTAKRANDKLRNYRRGITELDIQHDQQSIASTHSRYKSKSIAILQEYKDLLRPFVSKRAALTIDLRAFKQKNQLARSADYPESRFLHFALIISLFVIESVMNAVFFAAGSDLGFIGGWVNAMQYAAVNLAVSFFLALFVVRHVNHVIIWHKIFGALAIIALIVFIPSFNFFVGHFREIFALVPEEAQRAAVRSFADNPFALKSVESWLLLAVGIIFASIAAIDGYRFDDPYPGYGRISRRWEKAEEDYADEKEALRSHLSKMRDSIIFQLDNNFERVVQREEELNNLATMAEMVKDRFAAHLALLEKTANVVLRRYRDINQGVRSTPPPAHFHSPYLLSESLSSNLPDTLTTDEVVERKYLITSVLNLIDKQRTSILESYNDDVKSIEEMVQKLEYGNR